MTARHLKVMFRGYPLARTEHNSHPRKRLNTLLVDDVETTIDETQRLLFGCGILYALDYSSDSDFTLNAQTTYLYHADDLKRIRPKTYLALKRYAKSHHGTVLLPHSEYMRNVYLVTAATANAAITGYNLSFDIWCHATRVSKAIGHWFYNGLSAEFLHGDTEAWSDDGIPVGMVRYHEIPAGIGVRREFTLYRGDRKVPTCQVIDASQLALASTANKHSLRSAGIAFGCKTVKYDGDEVHDPELWYARPGLTAYLDHYVSYNVNDVHATADVWRALMTQFNAHPIQLDANMAFSPASIAKQYIRDAGYHGVLCVCKKCRKSKRGGSRIAPDVLGLAMSGFYGGRADCGIRMTSLPGVLCDFVSEYPTSMILLGIWELFTADRIDAVDETGDIQKMLDNITLDDCFNPAMVRKFCGIVEIIPDNDLLPVRANYEPETEQPGIGLNYLTGDRGHGWSIADAVNCKILTGSAPRIVRGYRFYPAGGLQTTLTPIRLQGRLPFDPRKDNLPKFQVEERQKAKRRHKSNNAVPGWNENADKCLCPDCELSRFLKVFVNGIYGIFAEMNHTPRAKHVTDHVTGLDLKPVLVKDPETSGEFCFPPFATMITGMGRLLLGMLQASVREIDSDITTCDTDSASIPASPDGGIEDGIQLLTYAQVNAIRARFNQLNPYDPSCVPEILKWEWPEPNSDGSLEPVRILSISSKRYCIYRQCGDTIEILKRSEHGVGQYMNPLSRTVDNPDAPKPDWISELWEYVIRTKILGQEPERPEWFDYPAITVEPVRTLHTWQAMQAFNEGKPYNQQIKPYNFHIAVHQSALADREVKLITPMTRDASVWSKLDYIDVHTRQLYRITTDIDEWGEAQDGAPVLVNDYGTVVHRYMQHPEYKYDDASGNQCSAKTRGKLQPCHIITSDYAVISKDASSITPGEAKDYTGHRTYEADTGTRFYMIARNVLKRHGVSYRRLAADSDLTEKQALNFLSENITTPRKEALEAAIMLAANVARKDLIIADGRRRTTQQVLAQWAVEWEDGLLDDSLYRKLRRGCLIESETAL